MSADDNEATQRDSSERSAARLLDHVLLLRQPLPADGLGLLPHETELYNFYLRRGDIRLTHAGSQFGQDLWIAYLLDCWNPQSPTSRKGFFVEFGAFDGVTHSNSLLFEKRFKWRGILAEPLPSAARQCKRNRDAIVDARCVWRTTGESLPFNTVPGDGELATLKQFSEGYMHAARRRQSSEEIAVATVSLNDLLQQHGAPPVIDYMSVDTEGSELAILEAFDFDRWRVRVMSVEHNWTPQRSAIRDLLERRGFSLLARSVDYCDDIYTRLPVG